MLLSRSCAPTCKQFQLWNRKARGFLNFVSQGLDVNSQMTLNIFLLPDSWGQPWYPGCQRMKTFRPIRFFSDETKKNDDFFSYPPPLFYCCNSIWFLRSANNFNKYFLIALMFEKCIWFWDRREIHGAFPAHKKFFTNAAKSFQHFFRTLVDLSGVRHLDKMTFRCTFKP